MERDSGHTQMLQDYIRLCGHCLCFPEANGHEAYDKAAQLWGQLAIAQNCTSGPLCRLRECFSLDGAAWFCTVLALCCALDGGLSNTVQELSGLPVPTFDLALSLYGTLSGEALFPTCVALTDPVCSPLRFLLELDETAPQRALFVPLIPRRNVLFFVATGTVGIHGGDGLPPVYSPLLKLHDHVFQRLVQIKLSPGPVIMLAGIPGSGKRTLAARLAAKLKRPLISMHINDTFSPMELYGNLLLSGGILCVQGYTAAQQERAETLLRQIPAETPLILLTAESLCPPPEFHTRPTFTESIGMLDADGFTMAWEMLNERYLGPGGTPLASGSMTIGQMEHLWLRADVLCKQSGNAGLRVQDLKEAARAISPASTCGKVQENGPFLDDLVLPGDTIERLQTVCTLALQRQKLDRLYQSSGIQPYGKGMTALFYGPPGTGKTMAAAAIANVLDLPLLYIDLSTIMDKYIGETEKHLSKVFAEAKGKNCILFFDEADALFSKRTEVASSHDRYANVETAFLLQCLEAYDGTVLLATNLYQNFDPAFLRRITLTIRFPMPEQPLRETLWGRAFLPSLPLEGGPETMRLVAELELSPAEIRSAAQTAAALGLESGEIKRGQLLFALEMEMEKRGQSASLQELRTLFKG